MIEKNHIKQNSIKFALFLQRNRYFTYDEKLQRWCYTFEHGTAIDRKQYINEFTKTSEQLYDEFTKEELQRNPLFFFNSNDKDLEHLKRHENAYNSYEEAEQIAKQEVLSNGLLLWQLKQNYRDSMYDRAIEHTIEAEARKCWIISQYGLKALIKQINQHLTPESLTNISKLFREIESDLYKHKLETNDTIPQSEVINYLQGKLYGNSLAMQHVIFEAVHRIERGNQDPKSVMSWFNRIEKTYNS